MSRTGNKGKPISRGCGRRRPVALRCMPVISVRSSLPSARFSLCSPGLSTWRKIRGVPWDVKRFLLLTTAAEICHSVVMRGTRTEISAVQRVIGLMSGTSADGVDAVMVDGRGHGLTAQVHVLADATYLYDATLRAQILAASYPESSSVDLICHLNFALGECFAEAAIAVAHMAGLSLDQIDLIGSHGQTIYHIPKMSNAPLRRASTLQIGEPCIIAERTGITTVADFRPRDMAAGGLGAPMAPYGHYLLFADPQRPKLVQNIGGIANVTVLAAPDVQDLLAFDTGPGDMLIDGALRHVRRGQEHYAAGCPTA